MIKNPKLEDMALKGFPVTEQTSFFEKPKKYKAWKIDILIVVDVIFSTDLIVSPSPLPFHDYMIDILYSRL